jgi:hypothetical protein
VSVLQEPQKLQGFFNLSIKFSIRQKLGNSMNVKASLAVTNTGFSSIQVRADNEKPVRRGNRDVSVRRRSQIFQTICDVTRSVRWTLLE